MQRKILELRRQGSKAETSLRCLTTHKRWDLETPSPDVCANALRFEATQAFERCKHSSKKAPHLEASYVVHNVTSDLGKETTTSVTLQTTVSILV